MVEMRATLPPPAPRPAPRPFRAILLPLAILLSFSLFFSLVSSISSRFTYTSSPLLPFSQKDTAIFTGAFPYSHSRVPAALSIFRASFSRYINTVISNLANCWIETVLFPCLFNSWIEEIIDNCVNPVSTCTSLHPRFEFRLFSRWFNAVGEENCC